MGIWNSSKWESGTAQCGSLEQLSVGIWKTVPLESGTLSPWNPINGPLKWSHGMPGVFSTFSLYDARHSIAIHIPPIQLGFSQQFRRTFRKICAKAKFYLRKIKADILQICLVRSSTDFYDEYHGNPSLSVQDEGQIKIYFRYHPKL